MKNIFLLFVILITTGLYAQTYTLTINITGNGDVTVDPDTTSFSAGDTVILSANGADGYYFDHWDGDFKNDCSMSPKPLIMDGDKNITAVFKEAIPAFPGAEGGGMYSRGGRGGAVIEVTNLNSEGPGSFREACLTPGPRTIVFRVGGTIDLQGNDINIIGDEYDNITIAGQTAPGGGIQIKGGEVNIVKVDNVIIRYIRFRPGPVKGSDVDALSLQSGDRYNRNRNGILDHVSVYWGSDETLDLGSFSDNLTVQWSIIAEGLHKALYTGYESWDPYYDNGVVKYWEHSRGLMISEWSRNISVHHNIIFNNYKRNPLIQSSDCDMVNNVIVSRDKLVYVQPYKGYTRTNWIGNYFRSYTVTHRPIRYYEFNRGWDGGSGGYYKDNYHSHFRPDDRYRETAIRDLEQVEDTGDGKVKDMTEPYAFNYPKIEAQPVQEAYGIVLKNAGANLPVRDSVDIRVTDYIKTHDSLEDLELVDAPPADYTGDYNYFSGWPTIANGTPPKDSDHDGMADDWEAANGLDSTNAEDRNGTDLSDVGYTNLEVYLDYLVKNPPSALDEKTQMVHQFVLKNNYPNPFNPTTTIEFSVDKPGNVVLNIYNVTGELVRTLTDGYISSGTYKVTFNGRDGSGRRLASGVYYYSLKAEKQEITKKMILLK